MTCLGLIAGNSRFPLIFAEAARREGVEVVAVAHAGETTAEIADLVPDVTWVRVGELGKIISTFHNAKVTQAVMAGGIRKSGALINFQPDERGLQFVSRLSSLKDDVILRGVAQELEAEGIEVVESTRFLSALIPAEGGLTTREPDAQQWEDIRLGMTVAKEIGRWDIGQSVVVKRGTVLAVEGVEGTNAAIQRGGTLGGGETVVVKMSKPQQDLRFDVPVVGPETIRVMQEVRARVLAVEANRTLMIEKPQLLREAEAVDIGVVAVMAPSSGG